MVEHAFSHQVVVPGQSFMVFLEPVAPTCFAQSSAHLVGQLSVGWLRWSVEAS